MPFACFLNGNFGAILMATTTTPATAKAVASSAKTDVNIPEDSIQIPSLTRREFMFYIWGASIALFSAASGGAIVWFMLPRFKEGEFGGVFTNQPTPEFNADPINVPSGKFWLTNSEKGIVALYKVCTHLGCLYAWVSVNGRFECPCHGSKYQLDGTYIEGPAPRSLDRFALTIKTSSGELTTDLTTGDPISVNASDVQEITVDTGTRIKRSGRV